MSWQYDVYLVNHTTNVINGLEWLQENLSDLIIPEFDFSNITHFHDRSKYQEPEYSAYDAYFYGNNKSYQVKEDFNYAWLHHIHNNPHHWQYWVLINDEEKDGTLALEMPYEYVIEMICDWWSFSWDRWSFSRKSESLYGIFDWYENHKDRMILGDNTRKLVEKILNEMRMKLDESNRNDSM